METPTSNKKHIQPSPAKTPSRKQKLQLLSAEQAADLQKELIKKEKIIDKEIAGLEAKGLNTDLNAEMQALHNYNDMKDLTQVVLGYLADAEQTTVTGLHKRYNLPTD